jgi:hypothetical protein
MSKSLNSSMNKYFCTVRHNWWAFKIQKKAQYGHILIFCNILIIARNNKTM